MLLGVDVGGTFTDGALSDGQRLWTAKVPTTRGDEALGVIRAVEAVLAAAGAEPAAVESFAHGMTVGTNALLEKRGARTALVTTQGFTDLLDIGRQNRPHLYRLCEPKPDPLVPPELRRGLPERIGPGGEILEALSPAAVDALADWLAETACESVAICLLFSYLHSAHEDLVAGLLRERIPELHVSVSSEVLPQFREYERCSTTVIDAYLSPRVGSYLRRLGDEARRLRLPEPLIMRSSGGVAKLANAARSGAWSVLSGPAGGAVGAGLLARLCGDGNALAFDMGGTSCDVAVIENGKVRRTDSRELAGRPIQLPMVDIHTVGAGGGSIAWRDQGGALRVGPVSAGATPGPACYGLGGREPTVTDANLLLGYLDQDARLAGGIELDGEAAEAAIARLAHEFDMRTVDLAEGIIRLADQEIVRALRVVTVERGIDPRRFALLPFGGAGPMHAAAVAAELGMTRILCPRACGVLSALGLLSSERRHDTARTLLLSGPELSGERLASEVAELAELAGAGLDDPAFEVVYEMRYRGQAFELPIPGGLRPEPEALLEALAAEHEARYGFRDREGEVELVNIRVAALMPGSEPSLRLTGGAPPREGTRRARFGGEWLEATTLSGDPQPGQSVIGPCILELAEATLVLPPGWSASVDAHGSIMVEADA